MIALAGEQFLPTGTLASPFGRWTPRASSPAPDAQFALIPAPLSSTFPLMLRKA